MNSSIFRAQAPQKSANLGEMLGTQYQTINIWMLTPSQICKLICSLYTHKKKLGKCKFLLAHPSTRDGHPLLVTFRTKGYADYEEC